MSERTKISTPQKTNTVPASNQKNNIPVTQGNHLSSIIQKAHAYPQFLTRGDVTQLQHTIGNRAVMQLFKDIGIAKPTQKDEAVQEKAEQSENNKKVLPEAVQRKAAQSINPIDKKAGREEVIQLAIDKPAVENFKAKLGFGEGEKPEKEESKMPEKESKKVKIVEAPNGSKIDNKIGTYPQENKYDIEDGDGKLTLGDILYGKDGIKEYQNDVDFMNSPAEMHIDGMLGGGGYSHIADMIVLKEGCSKRYLLHEMGHKKQNDAGFHGGNTDGTILEYHNVIMNENLYDDKLRLCYNSDKIKKSSGKNWDQLKEELAKGKKEKELALIGQIENTLNEQKYADKKDVIKQNLVNEYYYK